MIKSCDNCFWCDDIDNLQWCSNPANCTEWSLWKLHEGFCPDCGHSLKDNEHGPDQNDYDIVDGELVHSGHCTYCKECRK